ncbi:MAG: DNA adenine methylase, partial [Cuspidothrix sp.]
TLKQCPHNWLITYDDCPEIRENFKWANITEWELQYGMNNYKQKTAEKGQELFISNYEINLNNQIPDFSKKSGI